MKNFTLFILGLTFCANIQAQITITHSDFTLDPTGDNITTAEYDIFNMSLPSTGADMTWDYTNSVQLGGTSTLLFEAASNPDYPNANMSYSTTIGLAGMVFPVTTDAYIRNDAQGFGYEGTDIPGQTIPLESLTGNPSDTLFHVGLARTETNPWSFIKFPLNYNDSFKVVSDAVQSVIVEAPTFGLSYYQIDQVQTTHYETKVVGWGNLLITNPATSQDKTIEVLLQERTQYRVDSFFDVNNNPVPNALLNVLGLTQGTISGGDYTYYDFFAKGGNYRVMRLVKSSAGGLVYSDVNLEAFFLGFNVDTEDVKPEFVNHRIYPNPVQNHQFQLDLEKNSFENWQLEVYNLIGQKVHQEIITENNSNVYLDSNLSTGHYLYAVKNENGQVVARGKLML